MGDGQCSSAMASVEKQKIEEAVRLLRSVTGGSGDFAAPSLASQSCSPGPSGLSDEGTF